LKRWSASSKDAPLPASRLINIITPTAAPTISRMAAVALLEKYPKPTVEQIREGLDGNICRCGTYKGLLEAVLETGKGVSRG
jgi:hypothetical protein